MDENKIQVYMVRYDTEGKPLDVACGRYKPQDVAMFRNGGFVDVEEGLARKACESISERQPIN